MSSHFINNVWVDGEGAEFSSLCPATQEVVWHGYQADIEQCKEAMLHAKKSFKSWSMLAFEQRIVFINTYKKLLERDKDKLALLISQEVGKPIWESKTEVAGMINKIDISIDSYNKRTGTVINDGGNSQTVLTHRPHGVFVILGPYNFPGHLPNGHIIPALIAGNTVILKPSEQSPLVAEAMIKLFEEAQLPKGVISLVQGNGQVGQNLLNLKPNGVLFTGSYQTGKKIHAHFAGQVDVILALEMGGNNPLIVSEVKEVSSAVVTTLLSAFITSGQRCTCARRLIIPKGTWGDTFLLALIKHTKLMVVDGFNAKQAPFMGPVISIAAANALVKKQQEWLALGASSLLSMGVKQGALVTPGIIDVTNIRHLMKDEELFGPLLQVIRYGEFSEAMTIANDTQYGLSAGLISDNQSEQKHFYNFAKAGIVNINKQLTGASGSAPFGGIGASGNHRPSAFYAADFCAYPMATMSSNKLDKIASLPIGLKWSQ